MNSFLLPFCAAVNVSPCTARAAWSAWFYLVYTIADALLAVATKELDPFHQMETIVQAGPRLPEEPESEAGYMHTVKVHSPVCYANEYRIQFITGQGYCIVTMQGQSQNFLEVGLGKSKIYTVSSFFKKNN